MEKTHDYKSWLDIWESAVYCGNDYDEAHKLLNSVVTTIMEIKLCSMLDLIDFDCNINHGRVRPYSYSAVHGWTEAQIQQMYVGTDTLGYFVWLGPPVNLTDEDKDISKFKESNKCSGCRYKGRPSFTDPCNNCDDYGRPGRITKDDEKGEKEMKITEVIQQPEKSQKCCDDCKYYRALITQHPCCDCSYHSEFVPAQNKGEREMKLNVIDPRSITPKRIWFNEHDGKCFTTVEWEDGVKTTVSETLNATDYGGFTAALAKRIYGTGGTIRVMNQAIDKANEKKKLREELRKRDWLMKQWKREQDAKLRKEAHEERVREEVERLRAEREAKRRILGDQLGAFAKALSMFDCGLDKKEDHAE